MRTTASVKVINKDSKKTSFPAIDGVITSPPYVGLIDYHDQHAYAYHLLELKNQSYDEIGPATNGSSKKAQIQYQEDLAEVFKKAKDAMSSDGIMIVVAADTKNLYGEIANLAGLKVDGVINRHVNRRTGRRAGEFYESIFLWRK